MCIIPGFPAALLDDPPQPAPPPPATAASREQQQQQLCSSEDEHSPKARKPYTITKQREKWSDDEHDKFLEAVKLYGRAWRRIEEHVGSKTAVQIRSHAQKFFSKVARESTTAAGGSGSNSPAATSAIEIPPPRPKKRPLHPYPRKQGSATKKRTPASAISVTTPASCRQQKDQEDSGSPKSVLSATLELPLHLPHFPAGSKGYGGCCCTCTSSDSSITGPDDVGARRRNGNDGASSVSHGSESFDAVTRKEAQDKDPEQAPALVSFQLFGQTVFVSDPQKPPSCVETSSNTDETDKSPPPPSSDHDHSDVTTMTIDPQVPETPTPATTPAGVPCPCGVLPMLCAPLSPSQEQQQLAALSCPEQVAPAASHPWWLFYGGAVALPFVPLPIANSPQHHGCSMMAGDDSSGASADSVPVQDSPATSKCSSIDRDGERSPRSAFSHRGSGFVPYKRQIASAQQQSSPRPCSSDSQNADLSL